MSFLKIILKIYLISFHEKTSLYWKYNLKESAHILSVQMDDFPCLLTHITTTQTKTQDISSTPEVCLMPPSSGNTCSHSINLFLVQNSKGTKVKLKNLPPILLSDTSFFLQRVNITGFLQILPKKRDKCTHTQTHKVMLLCYLVRVFSPFYTKIT